MSVQFAANTSADDGDIISLVAEAQDFKVTFSYTASIASVDELSARKAEFLDLVRKLHSYYKEQINASLVSTGKFEKATRYFIRALRKIQPTQIGESISNLRELEKSITLWIENDQEMVTDTIDANLKLILKSFLNNIRNFRVLRQLVKMEILQTLRQLPEEHEDELQTRTRGEMEVLLSAWTGLLNKDNDFTKLEHPQVQTYEEYFLNGEERTRLFGVLSIMPKLVDIINRFDYLLVKYQMGTSTM